MSVWESGITGRGVTVCVIDDGLEWRHPDLRNNYSPAGSYDLNADDPDPSPVKNGGGGPCGGVGVKGSVRERGAMLVFEVCWHEMEVESAVKIQSKKKILSGVEERPYKGMEGGGEWGFGGEVERGVILCSKSVGMK